LKAPLRGIANLSQWLEEDLEGSLTPETRKNMQLLRGRVQRMEALIDGILDYSRAGRVRSTAELVNLNALLGETVELLAPKPPAEVRIGPGMPTLRTERTPLQQVFMNLIGNALKHADRVDPLVLVEVEDGGAFYEFSVKDNGAGIAPAYQDRIWTIFQTLRPRDQLESTGIGLAVVKKIVESRGGRAWVESQPGQGATFRFTWLKLPA
jgi:signal transduction histidine kinase